MANRTTKREDVDWAAVERQYRGAQHSNRLLAQEHGTTEGAIRKRAKAGGWVKAEATLVRTRTVELANDVVVPQYLAPTPERLEALAQVGADILVRHRTQAATLAGMVGKLAGQLDQQIDFEPDLAEQIEDFFSAKAAKNPLMAGVYKQQCNSALHAIGLNTRSKTMVNLTTAVANLTKIERQAWNLDDATDNRSYEDLLAELAAKTSKAA